MDELFNVERAQKAISEVVDLLYGTGCTVPEAIHAIHSIDRALKGQYPGLYPIVTGEKVIDVPSFAFDAAEEG